MITFDGNLVHIELSHEEIEYSIAHLEDLKNLADTKKTSEAVNVLGKVLTTAIECMKAFYFEHFMEGINEN